jgi:NADH:ubiquinone oxidoreductase subunit
VVYNGPAEASAIPPGWYGWMQKKTDVPPSRDTYRARDWEKPHVPNMTGTAQAYRPRGSLLNTGERPRVTGDYEAWSPE